MAKIAVSASDREKSAMETTSPLLQNIVISTNPVVITAVQRKAFIGNFETIDIYVAVALPTESIEGEDNDVIKQILTEAIDKGFAITSSETAVRYHKIKAEHAKQKAE